MIFITTDSTDIYYNLAAEYYLVTEKRLDDMVFMLWRTSPTTLVCGKYQNIFQEIQLAYVNEKKYRVARRLSGGGTVYQDENVFQYSFVTPEKKQIVDFRKYLDPMVDAMRRLGVPVEFNSRNDLMINDHKVSGAAQYNQAGYEVHHGTVLYNANLEELEKCLNVDDLKIVSKGIKSVRERVVNMGDYTGDLSVAQFMEKLKDEVAQADVDTYVFDADEVARIEAIADEKFRSWEWIFGKSPKCDMIKKGRTDGGTLEFHVSLEEGKITQFDILGDFFAGKDVTELGNALIGCIFERNHLQARLEEVDAKSYFYRVSNEDILQILI